MRPKIVLIVLATALLVSAALFAIRQSATHSTGQPGTPQTVSSTSQTNQTLALAAKPAEQTVAAPTNAVQPNGAPSSEDAHKAYVEQRSSQLMDLAMTDDRASLDTILSELGNRDPEIRKAALEATIQFGSRDAIPKLADAVSQTDDPNEKAALTDAIEFLKLPSLTEIREQQAANPVANNGAGVPNKPGRKGGFGKRDLPAPAPQPNQ